MSIIGKAVHELIEERDALAAFKEFVHRRLDEAGIPTHPDGPHSAAGCRIGDRLDIVFDRLKCAVSDRNSIFDGFEKMAQFESDQRAAKEAAERRFEIVKNRLVELLKERDNRDAEWRGILSEHIAAKEAALRERDEWEKLYDAADETAAKAIRERDALAAENERLTKARDFLAANIDKDVAELADLEDRAAQENKRLKAEIARLAEWVERERYGAELSATNTVDAAIEIGDGRAIQHVHMHARLLEAEQVRDAANARADQAERERDEARSEVKLLRKLLDGEHAERDEARQHVRDEERKRDVIVREMSSCHKQHAARLEAERDAANARAEQLDKELGRLRDIHSRDEAQIVRLTRQVEQSEQARDQAQAAQAASYRAGIELAKSEWRKRQLGGCRMLSAGEECGCFLCTLDRAALAAPAKGVCGHCGDTGHPTDECAAMPAKGGES